MAEQESEAQIVARAKEAITRCNWTLGECAAAWTRKYAKGRTDAAFAELVGLSPEQVYQRRRVFETFGDVKHDCPKLSWSHFYVALTWDDAADCLSWADSMEATVAEMRAWRRAQHGEDLSAPADDELAGGVSNTYSELPDSEPGGDASKNSPAKPVSNVYSEQGPEREKPLPRASVQKQAEAGGPSDAEPEEPPAVPSGPVADYRGIARQAVQSLGLLARMLDKDWVNLLASEQAVICDEVEKLVAVINPQGEADVSLLRKRLDWLVLVITRQQWAKWGESDRLFLAGPIEDLHQVVRVKGKRKSEGGGE